MACIQKGAMLNNNLLTTLNHDIIKYEEEKNSRNPVWKNRSNDVNTFFKNKCRIFMNSYAKDKMYSDTSSEIEEIQIPNSVQDQYKSGKKIDTFDKRTYFEDKNQNISIAEYINKCNNDPFNISLDESADQNTISEISHNETEKKEEIGWLNKKSHSKESSIFKENHSCKVMGTIENVSTHEEVDVTEPSHHARRPMNAFLIFCKRHRTVVKNKYPHLENRAVTKILGEWWAGLEIEEKSCYTDLAKQYKNAFFSANPNFKWYKLPAPPLRTLHTRPSNIIKTPVKQVSEGDEEVQLFNPGKLADETQLGSLSRLINPNSEYTHTFTNNTFVEEIKCNANESDDDASDTKSNSSPSTSSRIMTHFSKPFKKRLLFNNDSNKSDLLTTLNPFSIIPFKESQFETTQIDEPLTNESHGIENYLPETVTGLDSNLTNQELIEKVVDHMCCSVQEMNDINSNAGQITECDTCSQSNSNNKEPRKSFRSCKGLRYAKFMAEGKLLVNKRNKKHITNRKIQNSIIVNAKEIPPPLESVDLNDTIKKLSGRTLGRTKGEISESTNGGNGFISSDIDSYMSDECNRMFRAADFNLDDKIRALPSLSLEKFQQKKKENKKRKLLRTVKPSELNDDKNSSAARMHVEYNNMLTGSRKRKPRKQSITRLEPHSDIKLNPVPSTNMEDLFGLATLAEVAAKKAKIDQQ